MTDKIFSEANKPCELLYIDYGDQRGDEIYGSKLIQCLTIQEAVIAWRSLPQGNRDGAQLTTKSGERFKGREIDELYKP